MGIFSKFGGQKDYPALGAESSAAGQLSSIQGCLEQLVNDIPDKLEVVPDDDAAYVFIGKPPKKFGIVWIEDGEVKNLNAVAKEKGLSPMALQSISQELQSAYEKNLDVDRFSTVIAGKSIVVTPSAELKNDVENIISKVVH